MPEWVRLYHDSPTDPKWRVIAKKSGQRIGDVIAVWNFVLTNASANANERGRTLNFNCEDVAAALDLESSDVEAILKAMEGKVISKGKLLGWEKRNPIKDDGAAERGKRWRERKRTQANGANATETDTDTEKDTEKKEDDDNARARPVVQDKTEDQAGNLLTRICQILRIDLKADKSRLTWRRQVMEMLRDGISEAEIIRATEAARTRGVLNLAWIRATALSPPKQQQQSTQRRESSHEQLARVSAELIQERNRGGNHNPDKSTRAELPEADDDRGPIAPVALNVLPRFGGIR